MVNVKTIVNPILGKPTFYLLTLVFVLRLKVTKSGKYTKTLPDDKNYSCYTVNIMIIHTNNASKWYKNTHRFEATALVSIFSMLLKIEPCAFI